MKLPLVALFLVSIASVAYGNTPLTSAYLGTDYLTMGNGSGSSLIGCGSLGCGGEFGGAITQNGGTSASPALSTNFWCVDAQEDFSWGYNGYADVVALPSVTADAADVRYSNVTNSGTPKWTYTASNTTTPVALASDAETRYEMAAWLIQQYDGFANTITSDSKDNAIQNAIWDITSNSTAGITSASTLEANGYATNLLNSADADWVALAATCYDSVAGACSSYSALNPNQWAVVSWSTSSTGTLSGAPNYQTFLVQVVPEPGLFGVLGLGMIGLVIVASRRRGKSRNHSTAV